MRVIRIIGLAAIAALALTAWAGAGSAFAYQTKLCKSSAEAPYCPTEDRYAVSPPLAYSASSNEIGFQTGGGGITCSESTLGGDLLVEAGGSITGSVRTWTLGGCLDAATSTSCSATQYKPIYGMNLTWRRGSNGYLKIYSSGYGSPGWTMSCPSVGFSCTLTFSPTTEINGGSAAHIMITGAAMEKKGTSCPSSATTFTANYTVNSPKPLYIGRDAHPITVFCKGQEAPCLPEDIYPEGTVIKAENTEGYSKKITIATTASTMRCNGVIEAKIGANLGESQSLSITKWAFNEAAGKSINCEGCKGPSAEGLPYQATAIWSYPGIAIPNPKWHFDCGFGGLNCTYQGNAPLGGYGLTEKGLRFEVATVEGILEGETQALSQSGSLCLGTSPTMTGNYKIVQPATPLYISWK